MNWPSRHIIAVDLGRKATKQANIQLDHMGRYVVGSGRKYGKLKEMDAEKEIELPTIYLLRARNCVNAHVFFADISRMAISIQLTNQMTNYFPFNF